MKKCKGLKVIKVRMIIWLLKVKVMMDQENIKLMLPVVRHWLEIC